ncbi:Bactericidal permeability-increasing protein [Trichinella sp. T6]|nr:Bactericidal permeability-increasing protein [Trichinella sp. T6]
MTKLRVEFFLFNAFLFAGLCAQISGLLVRGLRKEIANGMQANQPGVVVRTTSKMISTFQPLISNALKKQIPQMSFGDIVQPFLHGHVNISSMKLKRFKAQDRFDCRLEEEPVPRIRVTLAGLDADIASNLSVSSRLIQLHSPLDLWAKNLSVDLAMMLDNDNPNATLKLSVPECKASIGFTDFRIHNAGKYGPFIPLFRKQIINHINGGISSLICSQVKTLVDKQLNAYFNTLPVQYPLMNINSTSDDLGSALGALFSFPGMKMDQAQREKVLSNLMLNMSLITKPNIKSSYIDTFHSGAVCWKTGGVSALQAKPMNLSSYNSERMLNIFISDYVLNSLLFLMFRDNLVYLGFDPNKVDGFKDLLKVPCDAEFCLGAVVPEFKTKYPKHQAWLTYQPNNAPGVLIDSNGVHLLTDGILTLYATSKRKMYRLLVVLVDLSVDISLRMKNGQIFGEAVIEDLDTQVLKHKMAFDESRFLILTGFTKLILQQSLNDLLRRGFKLPNLGGFQLHNPNLRTVQNGLLIETDMQMGEEMLQKMTGHILSAKH